MTTKINYVKKGEIAGAIADNGKDDNKECVAVTAVASKWFKTLKGAEKFMTAQGYVRA